MRFPSGLVLVACGLLATSALAQAPSVAAEPGAAYQDVPGTAGVAGVPDAPLGAPLLPSPGAPADTLPIARHQDITPDSASSPGAPGSSSPSANYLVMNVYLLAAVLVLGVILFMLAFPSRRQHA